MSIEKKFPWSFSGFIIGLLAIIVSVIIFYYTESKDKFDFKLVIEDEFNVIELKDDLKNLKILYNDEDIIQTNKEIKVVLYTFINEGKLITQNFYDKDKDFTIKFNESKVLSTSIISSNSDYLKNDFLIETNDSLKYSTVEFKKLIFETGKKITFKSYLIQDKEIGDTEIKFLGKIAGIDNFEIIRKEEEIEKEVSRNLGVIGILGWFFVIYMGLLILVFGIAAIFGKKRKKNFEKSWKEFINEYPEHQEYKEIVQRIEFNFRLKQVVNRLIRNENIINISEYVLLNEKKTPLVKFFLGKRNWISFPNDTFVVMKNNSVKLKSELYSLFKDYKNFTPR